MATAEQKRGIRLTVFVVVLVIGLIVALTVYNTLSSRAPTLSADELQEKGVLLLQTPRQFSGVSLIDESGEPFTEEELQGRWSILFFGFTHCPDICPMTMADMNRLVEGLSEEERERLQIVLVTVDPERDTPEQLRQYVHYFNPEFTGVTGDPNMIYRFATELGIAYNKVEQGDSYTMDHTSSLVLINPRGHFHGYIRPPFDPAELRLAWRSMDRSFPD